MSIQTKQAHASFATKKGKQVQLQAPYSNQSTQALKIKTTGKNKSELTSLSQPELI